jgi:hypothetical protein
LSIVSENNIQYINISFTYSLVETYQETTPNMSAPQNSAPTRQLPPLCDSCQYCQNCDPNPGQPTQRLRFCEHGLGRTAIKPASHQDCPATASLRRSTNPAPQSHIPAATPNARVPSDQSSQRQRRQDDNARRGTEYINLLTNEEARAQYGNNYNNYGVLPQRAWVPLVEGPVRFEGLVTSGKARVHGGNIYNNYGYGYAPPTDEEPEIAPHLG